MKGRESGHRKRLAAVVRQRYIECRRGLPFSFRVDPPEPYDRQKYRDYEADDRTCMLAAAGRRTLRGYPLRKPDRADLEAFFRSLK